jgi:hypothetical protein
MKRTYHYYSDTEQGWLKIPIQDARTVGVEPEAISPKSYRRGSFLYLDEDKDAMVFLEGIREKGAKLNIKKHFSKKSSKIRSYEQYQPGFMAKRGKGFPSKQTENAFRKKPLPDFLKQSNG